MPQVNLFVTRASFFASGPVSLCRVALIFTAIFALCGSLSQAQNTTLEGQTGGFITPTAYIVPSDAGHRFSHPVVAFHFISAGDVIGDVYTISVTEGLSNRVEAGYTRSFHSNGENPYFSPLWFYDGFNVVHGKVNIIPETAKGHAWVPAVGIGGVYRNGVHYVSGAIARKSYDNGDVYIVATRTLRMTKPPLLLNFGYKGTNASIFGVGGNSPDFVGKFYGGLGIGLPLGHGLIAVPAAGFTQEPRRVKNLPAADIPTTMDYAVRITQRENPRFAFDAGVGQVAGRIMPGVNLHARSVFGMGLTYKF
ncbi:MAG TPA: DUF3034 family protein [Acidisarcina sp.]|nr:DUF3034 family protein [Acidisarcina sp.]